MELALFLGAGEAAMIGRSGPVSAKAKQSPGTPSPTAIDRRQEKERIQQAVAELRGALGLALLPGHHPWTPLPRGWKDADRGKRPALDTWVDRQHRRPTPEEEQSDFAELRNPGMATGLVNGVVVLDLDDAAAIEWADKHVPPTPIRAQSGSGQGEHRLYRFDPERPIGNKARLRTPEGIKIKADIRGQGGFIVLPGARHPSGGLYRMLSPWTAEQLATLPELPEELIAGAITAPPPSLEFRYAGNGDLTAIAERARAYIAKAGPAIQGEGGDHHTFRICAILTRNFALPENEAWRLLVEWNRSCVPPWSEKELRAKMRNAIKYAKGALGSKASTPPPFHSVHLGTGTMNGMNPGGAEKLSVHGSVTRGTESKFRFRTAREIGEAEPELVNWILRAYVAVGAVTLLDGKPKCGKTTWLLRLVRAVLDGGSFMGENVRRSPVVLLSEQNAATLRPALESAGLLDRDDLRILFWHETQGASWPEVCAAALAECHQIGAALLVVDTLSQFSGLKDENAAPEVLAAIQPLQAAAASGRAVLVVRHDRKSGGEVGDSGRGSNALTGAVDVVLNLTRMETPQAKPELRNLRALSRFEETPPKTIIELSGADYIVHGAKSAFAKETALEALEEILPTNEAAALDIEQLLGKLQPRGVNLSSLKRAIDDYRGIRRVGMGKKGDPFRYWREETFFLSMARPHEQKQTAAAI
jgi:AAA domain-containing protein/bifunctional DNA primase/polymerase-like protein